MGIDAGITSLIATSDGEKIANPKHFKRLGSKLRQAQKTLSGRVKGSNNREKARREVARIQAAIADTRKDFLHKLTTRLVLMFGSGTALNVGRTTTETSTPHKIFSPQGLR